MLGKIIDFSFGLNRKQRITFEVDDDFREQFDKLKDCSLDIKITKYRQKRSLDANAYMWVMLQKQAEALEMKKEDIYRMYIMQYGIFRDWTLTEEEYQTFQVAWAAMGTGWITEKVDFAQDGDKLHIRSYYGSSCYNTKQMSRLINAVVQGCAELGIETLSERELSLLVDKWEGGLK